MVLTEALGALAAAGGAAVVQAAAADAWGGTRVLVAQWFSRSEGSRVPQELELLDETAQVLGEAAPEELAEVTAYHEALWRGRFEGALAGGQDAAHQVRAAAELKELLARIAAGGGASSGDGGLAVGGSVEIRSMPGSIAAGVINGGAVINPPLPPERTQG